MSNLLCKVVDIAFGVGRVDCVAMRNWHPSSTPLFFYYAEVGKLKVSQAPSSQGLICKSIFPFKCKCWRFERWVWGRDCFSCCFYCCYWQTGWWRQELFRSCVWGSSFQLCECWVAVLMVAVFSWLFHCSKVDMFLKSTVQLVDCWSILVLNCSRRR